MSEIHLTLSPNDLRCAIRLLTADMNQKRVEVRRTEFSRESRHQLEAEEELIHGLLDRLQHVPVG